jgi:MFS transporter, DHA1 family, inner membrane transport protein
MLREGTVSQRADEQTEPGFRAPFRDLGPHERAFRPLCDKVKAHCTEPVEQQRRGRTLFALALGSFCIGTSEFASMGIIQLFSADIGISVPEATDAITAYAFGVVTGAPLITLAAARLNRRTVLLFLMGFFILGNLLSAAASALGTLALARFISGMPQGAYFGAGAVVASYIVGPGHSGKAFAIVMAGLTVATIFGSPLATFLGQTLGWRATYLTVAGVAALALLAIASWVPRTDALRGGPVMQELNALWRSSVWGMILVAAVGVASIFAVYTFIGPFVTDVVALDREMIPLALALFGIGMTAGNLVGGRLADSFPARGIAIGFGAALVVLAILAIGGSDPWIFMPAMFGVGATMMTAIPTIQVRLTRFAPEAPTLMGAMNLAALNVANAIGAWAGGLAVSAGLGLLSAVWAGFALTALALAVFGFALLKSERPAQDWRTAAS